MSNLICLKYQCFNPELQDWFKIYWCTLTFFSKLFVGGVFDIGPEDEVTFESLMSEEAIMAELAKQKDSKYQPLDLNSPTVSRWEQFYAEVFNHLGLKECYCCGSSAACLIFSTTLIRPLITRPRQLFPWWLVSKVPNKPNLIWAAYLEPCSQYPNLCHDLESNPR